MKKLLYFFLGSTRSLKTLTLITLMGAFIASLFIDTTWYYRLAFAFGFTIVFRVILVLNDWGIFLIVGGNQVNLEIYKKSKDIKSLEKDRDELLKLTESKHGYIRVMLTEERAVMTISLGLFIASLILCVRYFENVVNWLSILGVGIALWTMEIQHGKERLSKKLEQVERWLEEEQNKQMRNKINRILDMVSRK